MMMTVLVLFEKWRWIVAAGRGIVSEERRADLIRVVDMIDR